MSLATASENTRPKALITGATRGIGLAIAKELAATHHLIVGATTLEAAQALADTLPSAQAFAADFRQVSHLADALPTLDSLDVLVHSAGIFRGGSIAEADLNVWEESYAVNVLAVVELTRIMLPALRKAQGLVVCINSGQGHNAAGTLGPYAASKFALKAFAQALSLEEAANGVRVTSIYPGRVDTPMQLEVQAFMGHQQPKESWIKPQSIANIVRLCVDSDAASLLPSIDIRPTAQG